MSWNGSDQSGRATSTKSPDSRPRGRDCPNRVANGRNPSTVPLFSTPIFYIPLSLLLLALLGIAAYYFLRPAPQPSNPPTLQPSKPSQIAAVAPAAARTNAAPAVVVEEKEDRNSLEWLKKHDKRYFIPPGAVRRNDGRLYTKEGRRILEHLPTQRIHMKDQEKKIFNHSSEYLIARLLKLEPGKFFLGSVNYGPKFVESFKKSLEEPTLVYEDDDDDTKALKRQVSEVKADLKARMDAGEDIVQIMKDTESDLRALSNYRQNMVKELKALRYDESVSEKDYADYVEAANKMLSERGIKKLSSPKFAESQLKYMRERHQANQAKKTKTTTTK